MNRTTRQFDRPWHSSERRSLIPLFLLFLILGASAAAQNTMQQRIEHDLLIVAHADDWQIFAGDAIASYLRRGDYVTIVQVSAGLDSESRWCWEKGQIVSLIAATGDRTTPLDCDDVGSYGPAVCNRINVNHHSIWACDYKTKFSVYFLRLPGTFEPREGATKVSQGLRRDGKTLRHLYQGKVTPITAIDGSTSYTSFDDLAQTVAEISGRCREGYYGSFGWCHSNRVFSQNPLGFTRVSDPDHEDHATTGCLALHVALSIASISINLFSGYDGPTSATQDPAIRARKLSEAEVNIKKKLFVQEFGGTVREKEGIGNVASNEYLSYMSWTDWGIDSFPPTRFSGPANSFWTRIESACISLSTVAKFP
jgi:hypothetical protein